MSSPIDREATRSERRLLPESYDVHWSPSRKADVVRIGAITETPKEAQQKGED